MWSGAGAGSFHFQLLLVRRAQLHASGRLGSVAGPSLLPAAAFASDQNGHLRSLSTTTELAGQLAEGVLLAGSLSV